ARRSVAGGAGEVPATGGERGHARAPDGGRSSADRALRRPGEPTRVDSLAATARRRLMTLTGRRAADENRRDMSNRQVPPGSRPRRYRPRPETLALLTVSGNPINGLGESTARRPSPFFWHPPDRHPYGELQTAARQSSRRCPGAAPAFQAAYQRPEL